jgi:6-phosphogluconolactonase (cycloisomerase 2 family)
MRNPWVTRPALSVGFLIALLCELGCGSGSHTAPPASTSIAYLYVGEASAPLPPGGAFGGAVAQLSIENNGTLTPLTASAVPTTVPIISAAVSPSNQYLFLNGVASEFGIGSDGILTGETAPAVAGNLVGFVPNGQFALVGNQEDATLTSYSLSSSGGLTPVNTVATGSYPETAVVDRSGSFAYVSNWNDGTVSEYTISASGMLTANGSISTGGYSPLALVISPSGFLYCGNANSGSVTQFSVNSSSGALTQVSSYVIWKQPQSGPLWISFDPAGMYAYVGNSDEIAQFTVDQSTGVLSSNGTIFLPNPTLWGGVDPSGSFLFAAGTGASGNGMVSGFTIGNQGQLTPNGSVSLEANMTAETFAFAQQ